MSKIKKILSKSILKVKFGMVEQEYDDDILMYMLLKVPYIRSLVIDDIGDSIGSDSFNMLVDANITLGRLLFLMGISFLMLQMAFIVCKVNIGATGVRDLLLYETTVLVLILRDIITNKKKKA